MQIRRGLLLGEQFFKLLCGQVETRDLAAGTRLLPGELAEWLGTGRIPVCDALKQLKDGLLISGWFSRHTVLSLTV